MLALFIAIGIFATLGAVVLLKLFGKKKEQKKSEPSKEEPSKPKPHKKTHSESPVKPLLQKAIRHLEANPCELSDARITLELAIRTLASDSAAHGSAHLNEIKENIEKNILNLLIAAEVGLKDPADIVRNARFNVVRTRAIERLKKLI